MKSIVLHDYFKNLEGGGRLSLILAQAIQSDLGYGFKVKNHPFFDVYKPIGKQFDLGIRAGHLSGWRSFCLINAFQKKTNFLEPYNTVIYSGFYSPLAVTNHRNGKNIYYCHTPPRFIYDQREHYFKRYPKWLHPLIDTLIDYYRPRYEAALNKMDCIVTNSYNVKKRIKTFLDIDASVVYPPCETYNYRWLGQGNFYLSAARLDPLKRVVLIVDAFKKMPGKKLIIISNGPEKKAISKKIFGYGNIKLLGYVDEKLYQKLIGECIASIYIPKDEDFGMTPIESMAAGKPVIGVKEGGLLESVIPGKTGVLIPSNPTVEDVINGVKLLDKKKAMNMRVSCQERAKMFNSEIFISKMLNLLN